MSDAPAAPKTPYDLLDEAAGMELQRVVVLAVRADGQGVYSFNTDIGQAIADLEIAKHTLIQHLFKQGGSVG